MEKVDSLRIFEMKVRELFTHGEGFSTPRARHKGRQPLIECVNHDFNITYFPFYLYGFLCIFPFYAFLCLDLKYYFSVLEFLEGRQWRFLNLHPERSEPSVHGLDCISL